MGHCSGCKKDIETFACDSCSRLLCRSCGGLTASEVKCLQLVGKRKLIFYCEDCENGLKQVPVLIKKITEIQAQINDLIESKQRTHVAQQSEICEEVFFEEISDRLSRRRNVMIFGVQDSNNKESDREKLSQIMEVVVPDMEIESAAMFRIGRFNKNSSNPRPIKLVLKCERQAADIMSGARLLKGNRDFGGVFIVPDRTKKELLYYKKVKGNFEDRCRKGEKDITVRYINGVPKITKKKN